LSGTYSRCGRWRCERPDARIDFHARRKSIEALLGYAAGLHAVGKLNEALEALDDVQIDLMALSNMVEDEIDTKEFPPETDPCVLCQNPKCSEFPGDGDGDK
jgi:hypothetical protein